MWWLATALAVEPGAAPEIELLTMEIGEDFLSRGGHATLCVREAGQPVAAGKCYNYGITDFSDPVKLIGGYVRGVPEFWVGTNGRAAVVSKYGEKYDRTVWAQSLGLLPDQARDLAGRLAADLAPGRGRYVYHHFENNCTSPLRDHLDAATGGALRRGTERPYPKTWREMSFERLADQPVFLAFIELAGRSADQPLSVWQAMAVPEVLRDEVASRLGAKAVKLHQREGLALAVGDPRGGAGVLAAVGLHVGFVGLGLGALRGWAPRAGLWLMVGWLLALASVVYGLPWFSTLSEVRPNEAVLYTTPADAALLVLRGFPLRAWIGFRAAALVGVGLASAVGVLVQPSLGLWPFVALPFAAGAFVALRLDGAV